MASGPQSPRGGDGALAELLPVPAVQLAQPPDDTCTPALMTAQLRHLLAVIDKSQAELRILRLATPRRLLTGSIAVLSFAALADPDVAYLTSARGAHELGADHPDVLDARHSKGKMLVLAGNGSQAVTLLRATAEDRARVQGDRHPDTLETPKYSHLARVQAEPRDDRVLDCAINGLERILRAQDRSHGPGYPMSHDTAEQLSRLLQLAQAVRFREPVPGLRQSPTLDEGRARLLIPGTAAHPRHGRANRHAHPTPRKAVAK
jgi:hypothetical protein